MTGKAIMSSVESSVHYGSSYILEPQNPDREPTRREDTSVPPPVEAQEYSLDLAVAGNSGEREQEFKRVERYMYRRKFGGWYAKLPDQKLRGTRHIPATPQKVYRQVPNVRSSNGSGSSILPRSHSVYTYMFLKLPWNIEEVQKRQRLIFHRFQEDFVKDSTKPEQAASRQTRQSDAPVALNNSLHMPSKTSRGYEVAEASAVHKENTTLAQTRSRSPSATSEVTEGANKSSQQSARPSSEQHRQASCQSRTSQSLLWQHAQYGSPSLGKLREQIAFCKDYGVSESEHNLFDPHIIDRLEHDFEHSFAGGKYLQPVTLRYVIQYLNSSIVDQLCIFLSFPYLNLMKPQSGDSLKNDLDHPPRTLLQYKYRFHDTKDRDRNQLIGSLGLRSFTKYINGSAENKREALDSLGLATKVRSRTIQFLSWLVPGIIAKPLEERLHISQLWGVLPGSNNLITCGTTDVASLCGDNLKLADCHDSDLPQTRSLLKLRFERSSHFEELLYPLNRCNS